MDKLGQLLVRKGIIKQDQLDLALSENVKTSEPIGRILLRTMAVSEKELLSALADQLSIPFTPNIKEEDIQDQAVRAVPAKLVGKYKFMPLALNNKILTAAISDPFDVWPCEEIKFHLGFDCEIVLCPEDEISSAIKKHYGLGAEIVEGILGESSQTQHETQADSAAFESCEKMAQDASVIKLVDEFLSEAVLSRATDVHIEPFKEKISVRYRIDGILYEVPVPNTISQLHQAIVSRIKVISGMDIVERRLPQDGRAKVKLAGQDIDLRVSVIPTLYGENLVVRILPSKMLFEIKDLGLSDENFDFVNRLLNKPHGIIFVTGPTGSGKTTTLYSFLSKLKQPKTKIITVEDPVEYEIPGITQMQVNPKIGLSFAGALRNLLRHDPDIMMVGEVRDLETAELAIRTALTGHLVFSTLHTNDAASGITRLIDMGLEPFLLASSVRAFLAQRLVRTVCPKCRQREDFSQNDMPVFSKEAEESLERLDFVYRGKGCQECKFTGYRGRFAIYEILSVGEEMRQLIIKKAPASEIKRKAVERGMKTLLRQGWSRVKEGMTTPEEIMRVTEL